MEGGGCSGSDGDLWDDMKEEVKVHASRDRETDLRWAAQREKMFVSTIASYAPPDPYTTVCGLCNCTGDLSDNTFVAARVECMDCPCLFICATCDERVHAFAPWHRRAVLSATTHTNLTLSPLERYDEKLGKVAQIEFRPIPLRQVCSSCGHHGWAAHPLGHSTVIYISPNGRVDLHHAVYTCLKCRKEVRSTDPTTFTNRFTFVSGPDRAETVFDVAVLDSFLLRQMINPRQSAFSFVAEIDILSQRNGFTNGQVLWGTGVLV